MNTGRQKFSLQGQLFVLAEDGTEVDFDYLQMIQTDNMLMILHGEEHWEACKPDSAVVNVSDDKGIFFIPLQMGGILESAGQSGGWSVGWSFGLSYFTSLS